jgi:hypothetical protein
MHGRRAEAASLARAPVLAHVPALDHAPAVLLISHDPAVLDDSDRVVRLVDGVAADLSASVGFPARPATF